MVGTAGENLGGGGGGEGGHLPPLGLIAHMRISYFRPPKSPLKHMPLVTAV